MKNTRLAPGILCLLSLMALTCGLNAETLRPGDPFPAIQSKDQHDQAYAVTEDIRWVAVTFTMGDGKKANRYLAQKGKDFLQQNNAVYLANILGMPAVARIFAMPKMQKDPHRIMLADEKGLLDPVPQEKGMATVFKLDGKRQIISVSFWDPDSGKNPFE